MGRPLSLIMTGPLVMIFAGSTSRIHGFSQHAGWQQWRHGPVKSHACRNFCRLRVYRHGLAPYDVRTFVRSAVRCREAFQRLISLFGTTLRMVFFDKQDNAQKFEYRFCLELRMIKSNWGLRTLLV
jgi:hypothetical protein